MGEFVVSGEIRCKSDNETCLSRKRQVGKYLVLRVGSREWGMVSMGSDWPKAMTRRN